MASGGGAGREGGFNKAHCSDYEWASAEKENARWREKQAIHRQEEERGE